MSDRNTRPHSRDAATRGQNQRQNNQLIVELVTGRGPRRSDKDGENQGAPKSRGVRDRGQLSTLRKHCPLPESIHLAVDQPDAAPATTVQAAPSFSVPDRPTESTTDGAASVVRALFELSFDRPRRLCHLVHGPVARQHRPHRDDSLRRERHCRTD